MENKSKNPAKELEIPIYFHNYKLLKDKEIVLKGSNIYFVQGPNKVGKTSFLKALTSLQTANDDTPIKVTHGESEGYYEATIPASDGTMVTIRHTFSDNDKGKFIAIKEDGTKISSVTEIRNLFNYTPINVSEFFAMSNTAEGRRKQRDIILKLLSPAEREAFNQADLQEQHYYEKRTEVNRALEQARSNKESIKISDEDLTLIPREEEARRLISTYNGILDSRIRFEALRKQKEALEWKIIDLENQLKELRKREEEENKTFEDIEKSLKQFDSLTEEDLKNKINRGSEILDKITATKTKVELLDQIHDKEQLKAGESAELSEKIEKCRVAKADIVANSDLPVENISFENGYLTIDGFQFKESQVCESDGVLILANILAKINPGPIQIIGDASILDNEKLEKLNKIAEANNKVMFVDEVVRDANNMVVVGYEDISKADLGEKIEEIANGKKKKSRKKAEEPLSPDAAIPPEKITNVGSDAVPNKTESSKGEESIDKPLF